MKLTSHLSAGVKNAWNFTSTTAARLHDVVHRHRNNFTFLLFTNTRNP